MGLFDFLFQPGTPSMQPTSAEQLPEYLQQAGANMVGAAQEVANEQYNPYTGPQIAGLTPAQVAAQQQGYGMSGIGTLQAQQAFNTAQGAAGGPTQAQITGYMNPYMTQVADIAAQKLKDKSAIEQQGIAAQAAQSGGMDSTRYGILEAERQKNLGTGITNLYAQAQADAYGQGSDLAQFAQQQGLSGAIGMGTLAGQQQNIGMGDVQQQLGLGALDQGLTQQALNLGQQQWQQEQLHPQQQLNFLSGIMSGDPNANTVTTNQAISQPSFFESALGFGASAANIASGLGWQPFGKK